MNTFWQNIRFAIRMLVKKPSFTLVVVATLALGIGANTAIFSVVYGVLIKPLPYKDPDRLVRVFEHAERAPRFPMSPANFLDYRAENTSFESIALYAQGDLQLAENGRPEHLSGMQTTSGFFGLLGCKPVLGREFLPDEEIEGKHRVVILGNAFWKRHFNADHEIIGRSLRLSGESYTVVGVLPPDFQHVGGTYRTIGHGSNVDIWSPLVLGPKEMPRTSHYLNVVARLRDGVTMEQAEQEMQSLAANLEQRYPRTNSGWSIRLFSLRDEIVGTTEPMLFVLLGAVTLVLLIACVNIASLQLARSASRAKEIAVRAALGAGRGQIIKQLLTESMMLSLVGGLGGVALASWGIDVLMALAPKNLPRLYMVGLDSNILIFATTVTLLTGILFGIVPALQMSKTDLTDALKEGGRIGGMSRRSQRMRRVLVIAEIAMAFTLLVGAGLLIRSFSILGSQDPGFRAEGVLTLGLSLPESRYNFNNVSAFHQPLLERIAALPGVQSVGTSSDLPWTGYDENSGFAISGREFPEGQGPSTRYHQASPDYFKAIGTPLIAGRFFTPADNSSAPQVVLINESLARKYWAEENGIENAVGARIRMWGRERTIVGVIGDIKDTPSSSEAKPSLYFPFDQQPWPHLLIAIRTSGDPAMLIEPIRNVVLDLDSELPVTNVRLLEDVVGTAATGPRFTTIIVSVFAFTALFLAVVGIYGVIAETVSHRVQEIGIRIALGATTGDVLRLIISQGLLVITSGLAIGIVLSLALMRLMASLLYGVSTTDPITFLAVSVTLFGVALAASYIPARRAIKVDPMIALRHE